MVELRVAVASFTAILYFPLTKRPVAATGISVVAGAACVLAGLALKLVKTENDILAIRRRSDPKMRFLLQMRVRSQEI